MVLVIIKIFFYKKTSSVQVSSFNSLKNFFGNQGKIKVFFTYWMENGRFRVGNLQIEYYA